MIVSYIFTIYSRAESRAIYSACWSSFSMTDGGDMIMPILSFVTGFNPDQGDENEMETKGLLTHLYQ